MQALLYTLAPVLAVVLGAIVASRTKLKPGLVAGLQHLAAGVVFAAAATEILPQVKHEASPSATLIGGAAGVATMLGLKALEARFRGRWRYSPRSASTFWSTAWCSASLSWRARRQVSC
jgi:ZIP family zinc transporter